MRETMGKAATRRKLAATGLLTALVVSSQSHSPLLLLLNLVNGFQSRHSFVLVLHRHHHHDERIPVTRGRRPTAALSASFLSRPPCFAAPTFQHHRNTVTTALMIRSCSSLASTKKSHDDSTNDDDSESDDSGDDSSTISITNSSNEQQQQADSFNTRRQQIRKRVAKLAKRLVSLNTNNPLVSPAVYAMPQAVAAVLRDATLGAVDMAVDEVFSLSQRRNSNNNSAGNKRNKKEKMKQRGNNNNNNDEDDDDDDDDIDIDVASVVDQAFLPLEHALQSVEDSLFQARKSLHVAKAQVSDAMNAVRAASLAQAEGAVAAVALAEETAGRKAIAEIYTTSVNVDNDDDSTVADISSLSFEDVDYGTSEMAPPFLDESMCLVPGEPVVRVEKAPENSRRIFAGIDILASVDTVWNVLTDYANLQNVVPNLVVNEVEQVYPGVATTVANKILVDASLPEDEQCRALSQQMKGSRLRQVGGAKVAGIQFSARTTLEVREWPHGMPDFAHFNEEVYNNKSRKERANDYAKVKLQRYRFPRPFCVSKLPTRDISMQSVENDAGEFRMYQGVWRMQPLPGCVPPGQDAMRLTYAVEVSPRAYLPVQLIEARIVRDLCTNLLAIRDFVSSDKQVAAV